MPIVLGPLPKSKPVYRDSPCSQSTHIVTYEGAAWNELEPGWKCGYCGSFNVGTDRRCDGCNARRQAPKNNESFTRAAYG